MLPSYSYLLLCLRQVQVPLGSFLGGSRLKVAPPIIIACFCVLIIFFIIRKINVNSKNEREKAY